MGEILRRTRSVCPVCLKNLPANLVRERDGSVLLERTCPEHGRFCVPVWRGRMDFEQWTRQAEALAPGAGEHCPGRCGLCPEHEVDTCCMLLEVTRRCNLHCRFCFAGGGDAAQDDPTAQQLKEYISDLARRCPGVLLQLSGGEPTVRDDLPDLITWAKHEGCSTVQLNTNGLRLAEEPGYAERLREAGLDIVFLQFDGVTGDVYKTLRGGNLLDVKRRAVEESAAAGLGVTLVPTVVRGVNEDQLGDIVAYAKAHTPGVRGVHFQPVSYFGRYPGTPDGDGRYTLDELMDDLSRQAGIDRRAFLPSRCDHPLCGFHAGFLVGDDGALEALSSIDRVPEGRSCAEENRRYVARRWSAPAGQAQIPPSDGASDFDRFLYRVRHESLTLSAMAFQDAGNLNIERLHRCSLHVYDRGVIRPFCSMYLTAAR